MFATDRTAMIIADPPLNVLVDRYGMKNTDIAVASMPAGPAGKFTQIGGELNVLKDGLTDEQIDACFKWLAFNGITPELSEERKVNIESQYKLNNEKGYAVGIKPYNLWKDDNIAPVRKYEEEMIEKYTNIDTKMVADYQDFDKVTPLSEPPINCQQLYSLIDGCIQKVWTDEQADPITVLQKAANDYQVNYLNKVK